MSAPPEIVRLDAQNNMPEAMLALLTAMTAGNSFVGIYDDRDYLRYASDSFLQAFDIEAGQVATFSSIILSSARGKKGVRIDARDPHAFIAEVQARRRVAHPTSPRQRAFPVDFVDDRWFWCSETLLANGWIVLTGSDITPLKHSERALVAARDHALLLSQVDELTGVANRRFALLKLDALMATAERDGTVLSVALLDLDHFKTINDRFGHEAGDRALRHFAQHCASRLRPDDVFGRLGGEEFVIVFPNTQSADAKTAIERILSTIPAVVLDERSADESLSFSAGVTEVLRADMRKEVLRRADKALYRAKQTGRRRVETAELLKGGASPAADKPTGPV
ncbi:sensor domain-containing diguanylate cyclase [Paraburkholderia sp. UCT31]|uniref:GGDEF domain-containing protein n=1 Tax=Paraburkholderia sp. UCT31 TaxID=2615209 RepID=UPI0016556CF8|nr:GGDEF domain-containing protein [Paraburkholderia sp. UCT31]